MKSAHQSRPVLALDWQDTDLELTETRAGRYQMRENEDLAVRHVRQGLINWYYI